MSPGTLRERIRFERLGAAAADAGAALEPGVVAEAWGLQYGPVSARITPLKGGEVVLAGRVAGTQTYLIIIRSCRAARELLTSDRCVHERTGEVYNLKSVQNPDERNMWLVFTAQTGVTGG